MLEEAFDLWWEKKQPELAVQLDEDMEPILRIVKNKMISKLKKHRQLMEERFNARLRRLKNNIMVQVVEQQRDFVVEDAKSGKDRWKMLFESRSAAMEGVLNARIQELERALLEVDEERLRLKKQLECHTCNEDFVEARRSGGKSIPCNHFGLKRLVKTSNPKKHSVYTLV